MHLAPILFCWNMVETTVFPWRKSLFFANWDAHASGESLVVLSLWLSLVVPSRLFLRPVLCFRSARRSVMMLCCVFVASRKFCAPFFSAGSLLASFWAGFSVFFMSWTDFLAFGRPAVLLLRIADSLMHTFVPAGAARPPTRRQIGSPR